MQPISSRNTNLYKGPSTSKDFNTIRNALHHDLYTLFGIANDHENEIKLNMDVLIRENFFLQNRLATIEKELEQAKINLRFKEQGEKKQRDIQTFYSKENIILMDSPYRLTDLDTTYGVASIAPSDYSSKVTRTSTNGGVVVPSELKLTIKESNDTQPFDESTGLRQHYEVVDIDLTAIFDQDKNTFWTRTASFPADQGVTEVYGVLEIKLPLNQLTDINANTIVINPYPEYSMDILDITYKGYGDQWFRLPNFPEEENRDGKLVPIPFTETGKMIYTFPRKEITEVQIHFRQPYWFKNGQSRDFIYGFQDINIENRVYSNEEAEFITVFDLEGTTKSYEMIKEPIVVAASGSEVDIQDLVSHQMYYDRDLTNEAAFGNTIMANIQRVYIKTTMRRVGDIIPVLKEVHLDYYYKDSE